MANPPDNNQLDTGPGGFVIDEPGVRNPGIYTYDVGPSSSPGDADYPVRDISRHGGNVNVDHSPKDISPATKTTLADYLGKKTSTNYYKVDGDTGYVPLKIAGENNTTPPIPAPRETTKNSKWFTQGKDNIGGVTPQSTNLSLRGWKTTPASQDTPEGVLKEVVSKGKEGNPIAGAYNGNDLLSKIDTPGPAMPDGELPFVGKISKYQNAVLSNNRFAMTAERNKNFDSDSLMKKSSRKNAAGVSSTTDSASGEQLTQYNPTFYHPKYGEITAGRLAQIGTALSLRASGEFTNAAASANDPTANQAGWQANQFAASMISLSELDIDRVIRELSEEDLKGVFYTSISDNSSWGNITNVLNKYSGFSSTGLAALAIAMSAGVGSIVALFYNLILNNLIEKGNDASIARVESSDSLRYELGSSRRSGGIADSVFEFFKGLLGIIPTTYSYSASVSKGNAIYFNLDAGQNQTEITNPTRGNGAEFLNEGSKFKVTDNFLSVGALNAVLASGQIVAVSRAIIRSSVGIFDNFADVFATGLGGGIGVERIKRLLSALESIGESKLMAALNMFATIGDAFLTGEEYREREEASRSELGSTTNVHESRVSSDGLKLSWASNRAPSLYLLPRNIEDVASSFGETLLRNYSDGYARKSYISKNRIDVGQEVTLSKSELEEKLQTGDTFTLNEMEKLLESEYVPFYLHDVRTNEIIAFHAFLESLSDDYTASYDSVEGIGRVEPVKIYKGTQRKIGMSFFVISTSPGDFDDMWEKINKLTTLLYPQYTEGRVHKPGNRYEFVQPFSQLVGASPMVRIRLGNLLRGNYSKFALARLFGAELNDSEGTRTRFNERENERAGNFSYEHNVKTVEARILEEKSRVGSEWDIPAGTPVTRLNDIPEAAKSKVKVGDKVFLSKKLRVKLVNGSGENATVEFIKPLGRITASDNSYNHVVNVNSKTYLLRHQFFVNKESLRVLPETQKKLQFDYEKEVEKQKAQRQNDEDEYYEKSLNRLSGVKAFMDENNNALVKSFKSVSGKGLAGFIESMNFDWYTNVTWDVDPEKKAPKMCKVTISFSPIHDISPGLDSNGYNRAPIYPANNK